MGLNKKGAKLFVELYDGEYIDDFVFNIVKYNNWTKQYELKKVDTKNESLSDYFVSIDDMCVGSVEFTNHFFDILNVEKPKLLDYPENIIDREIKEITWGKLKNIMDSYFPFFVKPSRKQKLFTGCVLEEKTYIDLIDDEIEDNDYIFITSDIIKDIISEYRVFVHENECVGIKQYIGNNNEMYDSKKINEYVNNIINKTKEKLKPLPTSYSFDIAITKNNDIHIIEFNDFFALGMYGLDISMYFMCYKARINQIKRTIYN